MRYSTLVFLIDIKLVNIIDIDKLGGERVIPPWLGNRNFFWLH